MTDSQTEKIEQKIIEYSKKYKKLVVGIDGYSGIGKTLSVQVSRPHLSKTLKFHLG